ncbi:hypothetical protein KEH51_06025 [[Brevibacterium] frigoritolerans]|uniref:Uncharacterized protein n=1 Tax=Peribacillus frigoritolerans TaxID=450367 RepID=A0A941FHI9_9BACI|nr:hypothetical protein [Peribacillus frigoritolerans]
MKYNKEMLQKTHIKKGSGPSSLSFVKLMRMTDSGMFIVNAGYSCLYPNCLYSSGFLTILTFTGYL